MSNDITWNITAWNQQCFSRTTFKSLRAPKIFGPTTALNLDQYRNCWFGPESEDRCGSGGAKQQLQSTFNSAQSVDDLPDGHYSSGDGGCVNNGKTNAKANRSANGQRNVKMPRRIGISQWKPEATLGQVMGTKNGKLMLMQLLTLVI